KIGLILGFQNYAQLEQVYSRREAQIIMDQPATQVFFKQKKIDEARDLAEAIGRTTVEEATLNDSGRVHELIQGRHLITPDELISLNKEVIVFTADVKPIKLALTSPTAYEQALSYEPPQREEHEVSEFIRKRGRTGNEQEPRKQPGPQPGGEQKRKGQGRDRKRGSSTPPSQDDIKPKPQPGPKRDPKPPEYDDI
ncbi:MAG: TraM recognition domain-containing protein, partial [Candidatus Obscuribacterales bacterium]|nr:TraM recognition domain-containing protein [Candidatus Obscuribacterales bacterium]